MQNYITDVIAITHAATRLASYPCTDHQLEQVHKFAQWMESQAQAHEQYFAQQCWGAGQAQFQQQRAAMQQPETSTLRRATPMRAQSMSRTPPPVTEAKKWQ